MKQSTIAAIIIGGMFAICATGCILISIMVQDGDTALARVGLLTGFFTSSAGIIVLLVRQDKIETKVDEGNALTGRVLNGEMEAKIKGVLHDVLTERLNEPDRL